MKKVGLIGAALGLIPVVAMAADLPMPAPMAAPPAIVQFNQWAGLYGGISFGWNWGDSRSNLRLPEYGPGGWGFEGNVFRGRVDASAQQAFDDATSFCSSLPCYFIDGDFVTPELAFAERSERKGGAVFTLNAGYNWQLGSLLLGIEADMSAMNRRHDRTISGSGEADFLIEFGGGFLRGLYEVDAQFTTRARMNWMATARLRAGYAAGPMLFYATGGLAAANAKLEASGWVNEAYSGSTSGLLSSTVWTGRKHTTELGWTLGGGIEWQAGLGFSLKAEYLYYDLGHQTLVATGTTTLLDRPTLPPEPAAPIRVRRSLDGHVFRVGLNFGFPVPPRPAAPVVAAY